MIAVIKQRNAKYRNRRRRIHSDLELTPNRYLEILSNDYGVLVDIQNKTWHVARRRLCAAAPATLSVATRAS